MRIIYFTDPICSACWMVEPQIRKLLIEYSEHIRLEHHMGGLLPSWDAFKSGSITKPSDVAHHWDQMGTHYGMPIDGEVWLTDPLPSSYPACMAFKAAELQGVEKAERFLRRIREMVMLEKTNIARPENLRQAALESGIDMVRFDADYNSSAQQLFRQDLQLCAQFRVQGFPSMFFVDDASNKILVYGARPYGEYEAAVKKLAPSAEKKEPPSAEQLFDRYSTLTTKEFSMIKGVLMPEADRMLSVLAEKGIVKRQPVKNGVLWKNARVN